jgi:hypothetical protein
MISRKIMKYISDVAEKEGFKNLQIKQIEIKNKDTSALCNQKLKIIYLNTLFPSNWGMKDFWKLFLHEIAHLFPVKKEITLGELEKIKKRCLKEKCSDPTSHLPQFWKHFDRLKRKYPYSDFLKNIYLEDEKREVIAVTKRTKSPQIREKKRGMGNYTGNFKRSAHNA